MILLNGHFI
jgi:hypothetical protein